MAPDSPRTVRVWYAMAVSFFACLLITVANVGYTTYAQRESDRRWCSLLVSVGDAQRRTPPTTDSGRDFATQIERLRQQFGC